jgi:hypothetical protein
VPEIISRDRVIADPKHDLATRDARIYELERHERLDSTNSSKHQYSHTLTRPKSKDNPKRKPGAKNGHPGKTRQDWGEPDRV